MSTYPFWLLSFRVREDLDPHVVNVLCAVGRGDLPDAADLDRLPESIRPYLEEPGRMQSDQGEAVAGTPFRLAKSLHNPERVGTGLTEVGPLELTIEFAQRDDEFANGGWLFCCGC